MATRATFPQVPGEWVRAEKYDAAVSQRDQLREALESIVRVSENSPITHNMKNISTKARAALKATEEG